LTVTLQEGPTKKPFLFNFENRKDTTLVRQDTYIDIYIYIYISNLKPLLLLDGRGGSDHCQPV
jgi:hypothetical protein